MNRKARKKFPIKKCAGDMENPAQILNKMAGFLLGMIDLMLTR
ncbi:hypothetical protein LPC_1654 [Legionella pneumophila str. Corby]|nr:hypothetical protein LPC_1654 [Legionella pneumophila str. Corby]ADG25523.1 hypothetical protein lpa_03143 [Legionella pneumophila 2300/99 Alcoy]